MLKAVLIIAAILVVAVVVVLALALSKPDDFRVARSLSIKAPAEKIYPLIADLHAWNAWSPYEKKDPQMKRTFSGAPSGNGAIYAWEGNKNVGSGRMEIIDTSAPSKIVIKLDFFTPFEGHNTGEFTLAPRGDSTEVTWAMRGPAPLMSKVMQVFINLDSMIGNDFAAGLASLKAIAEK